jgi:hypothetical protein
MEIYSTYNHVYNSVEYVQALLIKKDEKNIYIITPPIKRFHSNESWMSTATISKDESAPDVLVSKFIKENRLKIISEDDFGYVLEDNFFILKNKGVSKYFPLSNANSKLEIFKYNKNVAERLKFYSYYLKAITGKSPEYEIAPSAHKYNIDDINIINPTFLKDNKLIVPSKKTGEKLKKALEKLVVNKSYFEGKTLIDAEYKEKDTSLIFSNVSDLKAHNENVIQNSKQDFRETYIFSKQPYFMKIEDSIYILQNLKSATKENAIQLCIFWNKNKINPGFSFKNETGTAPADVNVFNLDKDTHTDRILPPSETTDAKGVSILNINDTTFASLLLITESFENLLDRFDYSKDESSSYSESFSSSENESYSSNESSSSVSSSSESD